MPTDFPITKDKAIEKVLAQLNGPISIAEFSDRVLALWPSKAKRPQNTIRQSLNWDFAGKQIVFLDQETIIPIGQAMPGVNFRVVLSEEEVEQGVLYAVLAFMSLRPYQSSLEDLTLLDAMGNIIPAQLTTVEETSTSIFGERTYEVTALDLSEWYRKRGIKAEDSLIITILDWDTQQYRLAHEPAKETERREAEIEAKNRELIDILYDMLEAAKYEEIYTQTVIPTAYACLADPHGYPGDHWLTAVADDDRMTWEGLQITYADKRSALEDLLINFEEGDAIDEANELPSEEAARVYIFKANLKYRKGLWRRIEIQGGQTLAEFDYILRDAFDLDQGDHMSGFWKRIRRGGPKSRRFREVDLGSITPFGDGDGSHVLIGDLELSSDHTLKYVYDFGDWVEFEIVLEETTEPQASVKYPRLIEQNRPRYRYCQHCKEAGKKTVATWICIDCSNEQGKEVLACEDCMLTYHEGHYDDEVLY